MKKIMFNDKYGLTQAVLEGRKTQTRRIVRLEVFSRTSLIKKIINRVFKKDDGDYSFECDGKTYKLPKNKYPKYEVGEVVAIAQRYKDVYLTNGRLETIYHKNTPGWNNKMFVASDLMSHQIKITNVRVERLQDISDEDCMAEGVYLEELCSMYYVRNLKFHDIFGETVEFTDNGKYISTLYKTPREAYAALFDSLFGAGSWDKNPFVWVFKFELIE